MGWKDIIKGLSREEKDATREFVQDEVKEHKRAYTNAYMRVRNRKGAPPTKKEVGQEIINPNPQQPGRPPKLLPKKTTGAKGRWPELTTAREEREHMKPISQLIITYGTWAQQNSIPIEHLENFIATEEGRELTNGELKDIKHWKKQQGL